MSSPNLLSRWALALLLSVSMSAAKAADIGVSPARLELTLPPGQTATETVQLFSASDQSTSLAVSVADWTQDESGRLRFLAAGGIPYSSATWLEPESNDVTVPAGGKSEFRIVVHVPKDETLTGTYRAVAFFTTAPSASSMVQTGMLTRQRLGLIIYVTVAGTEKNGSKLTDMYSDGSTVHAVVSDAGNTVMRYSGTIEVRNASGDTVKSISVGSGVILRESERDIAVKMPDLPKGYYVLLLLLKDSRGGLLTGQLPYEVK